MSSAGLIHNQPTTQAKSAAEGSLQSSDIPPKPENTRYHSLDVWRGIGCLILVAYHATFYIEPSFRLSQPSTWSMAGLPLMVIRLLWIGVPIFAVVSGYCIAANIDSLRRKPHSLSTYCVRRARRIYPPLWIACLLSIVFTSLISNIPGAIEHTKQLPRLGSISLMSWVGNLTASELWLHSIFGGEPNYLMNNTWTLGYEEQYYVLAGLMLALSPSRFFQMSAVLTIGVLAMRHIGVLFGLPFRGFFFDGNWITFGAGILVYYSLHYHSVRQRRWTLGLFMVGSIYGFAGKMLFANQFDKHMSEYIFVAGLFGLLLVVARKWDIVIAGAKSLSPLAWCGRRSFSIYLTHYPLVVTLSSLFAMYGWNSEACVAFVVVPLGYCIALPVAALFHSLVERPFMNAPIDQKVRSSPIGRPAITGLVLTWFRRPEPVSGQ